MEDLLGVSEETKRQWMLEDDGDENFWVTLVDGYQPKSDIVFYKFKCRRCDLVLLGWDCS